MKKINKNKFIMLFFLAFALITPQTLATVDNIAHSYTFDDTNADGTGGADFVVTSVTYSSATPINGYSAVFDAGGDTLSAANLSTNIFDDSADSSIAIWLNITTKGAAAEFLLSGALTPVDFIPYWQYDGGSNLKVGFSEYGAGAAFLDIESLMTLNEWHHVVTVFDSAGAKAIIYVDGVNVGNASYTTGAANPTNRIDVKSPTDLRYQADQLCIYTDILTDSDVNEIYNSGSGAECNGDNFVVSQPYAHIKVTDKYDNSDLSGLTVYLGTKTNITDGSGIAYFYNNDGLNYTVDGGTNYFDVSGTAVENTTTQTEIYGAFPSFSVYDVEGTIITGFNLTSEETSNTTTGTSLNLLLPPNTTTDINVTKTDWQVLETNYSAGSQDTSNNNLTGLYQSVVTINATNAYTGSLLSNFTGWLYNNDTGHNYSFSTTGNTTTVNTIFGNYTGYIDVFGYSIGDTNTQTIIIDEAAETVTYALYSENSILVSIRNEETNAVITDNVTVTVTGNSSEDIYYTSTGELFLENLTDGNYTLKFEATNYSLRTYEVTVADRSTQQLTAFLSPGTNTVTFAILDFDNSQALEGASMVMQRLINSTWTTVESKSSDITGRAQFTYTVGVKYRFTVNLANYDSKVFELDPIIFSSYVIRLEKDLILDSNEGLFDVTITWYPSAFTNEENNTFTITFGSIGGTLEDYGYKLTYPGGSLDGAGTNANGGTFSNESFLITGAQFNDRVNLTYWYDSVYGANKSYTVLFQIDEAANTGTLNKLKTEDYELGTVEKIIISVLCTFLFAGILTLFGAPILGIVGGMVALGFFTAIGFLSVWITIPTFVVSFLMLARRSSE